MTNVAGISSVCQHISLNTCLRNIMWGSNCEKIGLTVICSEIFVSISIIFVDASKKSSEFDFLNLKKNGEPSIEIMVSILFVFSLKRTLKSVFVFIGPKVIPDSCLVICFSFLLISYLD